MVSILEDGEEISTIEMDSFLLNLFAARFRHYRRSVKRPSGSGKFKGKTRERNASWEEDELTRKKTLKVTEQQKAGCPYTTTLSTS